MSLQADGELFFYNYLRFIPVLALLFAQASHFLVHVVDLHNLLEVSVESGMDGGLLHKVEVGQVEDGTTEELFLSQAR